MKTFLGMPIIVRQQMPPGMEIALVSSIDAAALYKDGSIASGEQVANDLRVHGVHITKDGARIDPAVFFKP